MITIQQNTEYGSDKDYLLAEIKKGSLIKIKGVGGGGGGGLSFYKECSKIPG